MIGTIIVFLIVLSILVLVHEIGHFVTARRAGCKVDEFGIGFPPKLFSWKSKKTGIEYSLNWIPLGGFVRIKGESGHHKDHDDSFSSKPIWKRMIILLAGVTMNFVLAAVLFSVGFMVGLPAMVDDDVPAGARVSDQAIRIVTVLPDTPAEEAGFLMGDEVLAINDQLFADADTARAFLQEQGTDEVTFLVARDGEKWELPVSAEYLEETKDEALGMGLMTTGFVTFPPHLAIYHGVRVTIEYTVLIVVALYEIIKNLIVGQPAGVDMSGPIGIAVMTGQVARLGIAYLIQFTAILSINLAIINVLPLPALDGGRVIFLILEKLRGKPVNEKIEAVIHNTGFLLLIGLVLLITYTDVVRFGDQIVGGLKSLIGV